MPEHVALKHKQRRTIQATASAQPLAECRLQWQQRPDYLGELIMRDGKNFTIRIPADLEALLESLREKAGILPSHLAREGLALALAQPKYKSVLESINNNETQ